MNDIMNTDNPHSTHNTATQHTHTNNPAYPQDAYENRLLNYDTECDIVGLIYEMIEEAVTHGELDADYALILKQNPEQAMRWLEDNEGVTFAGSEPLTRPTRNLTY